MKQSIITSLLISAAVALTPNLAQAQTYGGAVLDHDIMMPVDFAELSRTNVFGTARSMAMGGAMTSLGGDISVVNINPAGLGMFSHETFSFTPMVSSTSSSTTGKPSWQGSRKANFSFANIGGTFNIVENGKGSLIALNAAVSFNRLADYHSKMSFSSESYYNPDTNALVPTIADIFISQLDGADIYPTSTGTLKYHDNPYYWPAQAAFQTFMIDPEDGNVGWTTNTIGHNASINSSYMMEQSGHSDEYAFSMGGNISNFLYFGATLGIQDIVKRNAYTYQEEYNYYEEADGGYAYPNIDTDEPLDYQLQYSNLYQRVKVSGSGVNLKLGLTIRPLRALRIGVAYHTPTYYSMARTYQTSMSTFSLANYTDLDDDYAFDESPEMLDNYEYSWNFRTPAKLLVGGSLQVGTVGVISADYERQWYNRIRVTNAPGELTPLDYQQSFEDFYRPTNTLRAGIEIKPLPSIALRAGAGYKSSMIKDESRFYSSPTATSSSYITCGVGFQFSKVTSLDLAYQFHRQNYSPYRLFYSEDEAGFIVTSDLFETSYKSNYFAATLTFRL